MEGYVNIDFVAMANVDKVMDLNKKWDVEDNSVEAIYASHLIEHLDSAAFFMQEAHRVLQKGGKMLIRVPYGNSIDAMACCFHKKPFYERTFTLFTDEDDMSKACYQYKDRPVYKIEKLTLIVNPIVKKWLPFGLWKRVMWLRMYLMNIVLEMQVEMIKL